MVLASSFPNPELYPSVLALDTVLELILLGLLCVSPFVILFLVRCCAYNRRLQPYLTIKPQTAEDRLIRRYAAPPP